MNSYNQHSIKGLSTRTQLRAGEDTSMKEFKDFFAYYFGQTLQSCGQDIAKEALKQTTLDCVKVTKNETQCLDWLNKFVAN